MTSDSTSRATDRKAAPASLAGLERLLARVDRLLRGSDEKLGASAAEVSGWSVAEHLFHLVLACDLALRNATSLVRDKGRLVREPVDRNPEGLAVLARGRLPRGEAEAPRFVRPPKRVDLELLRQLHGEVVAACARLAEDPAALAAAPRAVPHQALGDLTCAEWLRFARAHTAHHLLIVRDIRAARRSGASVG